MLALLCVASVHALLAAAEEAPLRSRAGQLDGMDSLLHWGDGQLDLARSTFLPGSPLVLSASWVDGSAWQACTWTLPGGEVWRLEDGQVVDETGDEVEGAESWGDSQAVCGIRISTSLEQGHSGRWLVGTQLQDGRPLTLSLETTDDLSEGLRLPKDFEPVSYDIGLVPDLTPSTSTHKQRFHGSCLMQLHALATQQMLTFHSDELAINLVNVSLTEMGSQPEPFLPQQIILEANILTEIIDRSP